MYLIKSRSLTKRLLNLGQRKISWIGLITKMLLCLRKEMELVSPDTPNNKPCLILTQEAKRTSTTRSTSRNQAMKRKNTTMKKMSPRTTRATKADVDPTRETPGQESRMTQRKQAKRVKVRAKTTKTRKKVTCQREELQADGEDLLQTCM